MVEATQADREAAAFVAGVLGTSGTILRDIMNGTCEAIPDEYELEIAVIQAFARHAEQACLAERERCARVAEDWTMDWTRESAHVPSDIAQAIRIGQ